MKNKNPPKNEKKKFLRERNNLLCAEKLCIEWKKKLKIYNKRMRMKREKNKGR